MRTSPLRRTWVEGRRLREEQRIAAGAAVADDHRDEALLPGARRAGVGHVPDERLEPVRVVLGPGDVLNRRALRCRAAAQDRVVGAGGRQTGLVTDVGGVVRA